jgi:hypothetical protein
VTITTRNGAATAAAPHRWAFRHTTRQLIATAHLDRMKG